MSVSTNKSVNISVKFIGSYIIGEFRQNKVCGVLGLKWGNVWWSIDGVTAPSPYCSCNGFVTFQSLKYELIYYITLGIIRAYTETYKLSIINRISGTSLFIHKF